MAYKIVFLLHILAVVMGFGGVMWNGVYGAQAKKRQGVGGLAIGEANETVSGLAEKFIISVPIWGVLLVVLSDGVWQFSQPWVGISLVLFVLTTAFALGVQARNGRRMNELAAELVNAGPPPAGASGPPPQVAEIEALGKKLGVGGAFLAVMFLVMLAMMVFKPGV